MLARLIQKQKQTIRSIKPFHYASEIVWHEIQFDLLEHLSSASQANKNLNSSDVARFVYSLYVLHVGD